MGDVGSTFLAAYFLINLLKTNYLTNIIPILLIISPLLMDAFYCVLRRLISGHNIFKPHKLHLYQRLCQGGMSHSKVTFIYAFGCLLLGLGYNIFGIYSLIGMILSLIFVGFWLEKNIAQRFSN